MTFDRGIPVPQRAARWDFTQAQVGDSLPFETKAEAAKFSRAVREWAARNGAKWGTKTAPHDGKLRAWIVERRSIVPATLDAGAFAPLPVVPSVWAAEQTVSTQTDEDIGLVVDLRRSEDVSIARNPEPNQVEGTEGDEPQRGGRRRRQAAPVEPKPIAAEDAV